MSGYRRKIHNPKLLKVWDTSSKAETSSLPCAWNGPAATGNFAEQNISERKPRSR